MNILVDLINGFLTLFRVSASIDFYWLYVASLIVVIITATLLRFVFRGRT